MRAALRSLRPLDILAVVVALLVVGGFSVFAYSGGDKNPNVIITASGDEWIYPLGQDREVTVTGPLGDELIAIKGGKAFVVTTPCPNKICVQQGKISRPGQWIACLPNKIFIRVSGSSGDGVDMISY